MSVSFGLGIVPATLGAKWPPTPKTSFLKVLSRFHGICFSCYPGPSDVMSPTVLSEVTHCCPHRKPAASSSEFISFLPLITIRSHMLSSLHIVSRLQ